MWGRWYLWGIAFSFLLAFVIYRIDKKHHQRRLKLLKEKIQQAEARQQETLSKADYHAEDKNLED